MNSHALVALGPEDTHYTASKIFPFILARKPLLAIFHEASSVVSIVRETSAGEVVTFGNGIKPQYRVEEILGVMDKLLRNEINGEATKWEVFESYTARSMAGRLAKAFNKTIERNR